jgi:DNA excision repair protein ERCC-2
MGLVSKMLKHKLLFVETPDVQETSIALGVFLLLCRLSFFLKKFFFRSFLANYRIACDSGRGAVFLSVSRCIVLYSFFWFCVSLVS